MHRQHLSIRVLLISLAASVSSAIFSTAALGQAGLRQTLEKMDIDQDGQIDPDEITSLSRPYLERITKARRMSLDRPNDIDKIQEAARIYFALQNGASGERIELETQGSIKTLMPDDNDTLVPEFGLGEVKYRYTQEDLDETERSMSRYDRNNDGYIDRKEAQRGRWSHRDPFSVDFDNDNRLSRMELTQRYARRRMLDGTKGELIQKARRVGNGIESSDPKRADRRDESQWWRQGGNSFWLTATMMGRFDLNKNGRLEQEEQQTLGMPIAQIDTDRNSEITRDEMHAYLSRLQDEIGDETKGMPGWFFERDLNADRQVSMVEFTEEWTDEKVEEFERLDSNGDGLITSIEMVNSKAMVGGSYANRNAEVLAPGRTVISEIDVADDFLIGDLNVQLSITHSNDSNLDAYLTAPDGQRIELFTEVGGRDDNFEDTIFDDQAEKPITKSRAPFKGSYLPEGLLKREASLSSFNGKNIKGVWQLVVRGTRSERFGMLHHWNLMVRPIEETPGQSREPAEPQQEKPASAESLTSQVEQQQSFEPAMVRSQSSQQEPSFQPPAEAPKVDYAKLDQRIKGAVTSGRLTQEKADEIWRGIKAKAELQAEDVRGKAKEIRKRDLREFKELRRKE